MNNAYNGQSQVGQRNFPTNAEYNNMRQRLDAQLNLPMDQFKKAISNEAHALGWYTASDADSEKSSKSYKSDAISLLHEQMSLSDDIFFSKQVAGFRASQQTFEEAQTLISPKITKQEKLKIAERNATQATRRSPRLHKELVIWGSSKIHCLESPKTIITNHELYKSYTIFLRLL
jgi:hypothetical protein